MRSSNSPSPHFWHFFPVGIPALYETISSPALAKSTTNFSQNSLTATRQGSLPSSISSSSSSRRAVKLTSNTSSKLFTSSTLTRSPSIVGVKRPWSLRTYSRSTIVKILAHVFRSARNVRGPHRFVRFLRVFLRFVVVRFFREVIRSKSFRNQLAHLLQRIVGDVHGIGAHVGDQRDGAFLAEFHAFVEPLRQAHGALGGVAQAIVSGLLQLGRREGRRRVASFFLLRYRSDLPFGLADRRDDFVRRFLVSHLDVLALVLTELGFEDGGLAGIQHRVDGPIFLRHEGANELFALHNQTQRHSLHAPRGQSPPHFVPQQRRNLIAHDAVQHAARLLRVHEIGVQLARLLKGRANGFRRNFVEGHAEILFRIDGRHADFVAVPFGCFGLALGVALCFGLFFFLGFGRLVAILAGRFFFVFGGLGEHHRQMRGDRFALAVRVARQVHRVGCVRRFPQVVNNFAFAGNNLQGRLENLGVVQGDRLAVRFFRRGFAFPSLAALLFLGLIVRQTDTDGLLGQVHHMPDGGLDGVALS